MRATRNPWFPRSLVVLSVGAAVGLGAAGPVARAKDPSIATDSGASLSTTEAAVGTGTAPVCRTFVREQSSILSSQ